MVNLRITKPEPEVGKKLDPEKQEYFLSKKLRTLERTIPTVESEEKRSAGGAEQSVGRTEVVEVSEGDATLR